jgi:hypothetical protein
MIEHDRNMYPRNNSYVNLTKASIRQSCVMVEQNISSIIFASRGPNI